MPTARPRLACAQLLLVATASAWNLLSGLRRKDVAPDMSPADARLKHIAQIRIPVTAPSQKGPLEGMTGAEGARVWVEGGAVIAQVNDERHTLLNGLQTGLVPRRQMTPREAPSFL